MRRHLPILALTLLTAPAAAQYQPPITIAQWDFNSMPPDASFGTGTYQPSVGAGAFTPLGGTTGAFVPGSSSSAPPDNSAVRITGFPAQGSASGSAGYRFDFDPQGHTALIIFWVQAVTADAPADARIEASFDSGPWQTVSTRTFTVTPAQDGAFFLRNSVLDVPPAAASVSWRIVAVIPDGQPGYRPALAGSAYTPAGSWTVDQIEFFVPAVLPPHADSFSKLAVAGDASFMISLAGRFDSNATFTSLSGPSNFERVGDDIQFTPPAPDALSEPSQDYVCTYTVTDQRGVYGTGVITVTVYNPAFCSVAATPATIDINCFATANPSDYTMTVAEPPGSGGVVTYRWMIGRHLHGASAVPANHPTSLGEWRAIATRTGGTGGCGTGGGGALAVMSNPVLVTTHGADNTADIGIAGGVPGHDMRADNNDFVVFLDSFFQHNPITDMGRQGGLPGPDGLWDNNDFVIFIDHFFAHCPF